MHLLSHTPSLHHHNSSTLVKFCKKLKKLKNYDDGEKECERGGAWVCEDDVYETDVV
jgi:hypothetical protein